MRPDERERMHRFCALMEKGREKIVAVFLEPIEELNQMAGNDRSDGSRASPQPWCDGCVIGTAADLEPWCPAVQKEPADWGAFGRHNRGQLCERQEHHKAPDSFSRLTLWAL
jgi:hypothetical protein